jgi:enoyl-CoA hydratase/carnithine racemase
MLQYSVDMGQDVDRAVDDQGLLFTEEDGVAVVTINRSHCRNALSRALLGALAKRLTMYEESLCRAVILEGAGGYFSAGADLSELDGSLADLTMDDAVANAAEAIRALPLPVIAAIEGPCIGAGVELAMACDLRVASRSAFFRLPAVRLGILYRPQAVANLSRCVPPELLSRLLLFGDVVAADEAVAAGMLTGPVVPNRTARHRALELAQLLPQGRSEAARATKRLLAELHSSRTERFEALRRQLAVSSDRLAALAAAKAGAKEPS